MRIIKSILKYISLAVLVLAIIVGGIGFGYFMEGYDLYQEVTAEENIEDKVAAIRDSASYLSVEEVSPYFAEAIIAVEDHRFYQHRGLDVIGLARAMTTNLILGDIVQGGSTITQQLAKNMYFGEEQTLQRKIAELIIALQIEDKYNKQEILSLYINLIYFGRGCYGIKDASYKYYDKDPLDLTVEEAAYLAGLPQAPSIYSQNDSLATQRQQVVLEAMGY